MLYEKFLNLIDRTPIGTIIDNKLIIIDKTNPDRIYVENIRSFYNLSYSAAKNLCELAVKERIFKKKIGVMCPNDKRIIKSYDFDEKQDEIVTCKQCLLREDEENTFKTRDLDKIIYYQLRE